MSADDDSPHHSYEVDMTHNAVLSNYMDFKLTWCCYSTTRRSQHGTCCGMLVRLSVKLDESIHETDEEKIRRYNWATQDEVSDPEPRAMGHNPLWPRTIRRSGDRGPWRNS